MVKYESMTKVTRNRELYEYFLTHPRSSLAEMGNSFSITKQRVSQIIKHERRNLRIEKGLCPYCGADTKVWRETLGESHKCEP